MSKSKKCWFHRWRDIGVAGVITLVEECEKCHWQRAFNGYLCEDFIVPPGTYEEVE